LEKLKWFFKEEVGSISCDVDEIDIDCHKNGKHG